WRAVPRPALSRARRRSRRAPANAEPGARGSAGPPDAVSPPLGIVDRRRFPHLDRPSREEPGLGAAGEGTPRRGGAARTRRARGAAQGRRLGLVLVAGRRSLFQRQGLVRQALPGSPSRGL